MIENNYNGLFSIPKINECFMFNGTKYEYDEGVLCIASGYG